MGATKTAGLDKETRDMVLETLREYAQKKIPFKLLHEHDQENKFPAQILKELYDPEQIGINLLMIPEEYGGLGGSTYDIYRACEVLARIDLGIATSVFATFLGSDPIYVGGTPEQKKKWISKIADERLLVAYGATEAEAGSDLMLLKTKAEPVEKDGKVAGYKINGSKQWISNGGVAGLYTVLAKTPGGPSWFVVEAGTEGFIRDRDEDKHGIRLSNTTPLTFRDMYVPVENLLGGVEGQGLLQAQAVFGYTRVMVAAFGLGAGWEALETAIKYSQTRVQAGAPLSTKQGYTHKLIVPYAVRLEAARAYIEETAHRLDNGEEGLQTEGAIAKYLATETGNAAAENAIQAMGGYGYSREFPVEKIKRDVKITCIYEGTSEIMEMTIFRGRWQEHMKSRGRYYTDLAGELDAVHQKCADVGANTAACGLRNLSVVLEQCRLAKLTRNQYLTFKLGELMCYAETALAFCRAASADQLPESVLFDVPAWRAMCRLHARETAAKITHEGLRLLIGSGAGEAAQALSQSVEFACAGAGQAGMIADMDFVAAKLNEVHKA
ncbi:MAG: acyl-CoA dehydrogenase family protein [Elusimicrobiota bacterium]